MSVVRKILCPVDFSDVSKAAFAYAATLAATLDAAVDLLHVAEPAPYDTPSDVIRVGLGIAADVRRMLIVRLETMVVEVAAMESARIIPIVESGYAAQCILARIEDGAYDLAVLGTAGREGIAHLLMGSVAERVVRSAACPVLTVRALTTRLRN